MGWHGTSLKCGLVSDVESWPQAREVISGHFSFTSPHLLPQTNGQENTIDEHSRQHGNSRREHGGRDGNLQRVGGV